MLITTGESLDKSRKELETTYWAFSPHTFIRLDCETDAFVNAQHVAAIDAILAGAKANGKPAGTPISDVAKARELGEQGFTLIDFGNDLRMLSGAAGAALKGMKA